ncbi:MAG: c-type cytochrome [Bacteroidota bacterium]|nr:c-type cytochrome [Bacteroidota bacterium]
MFLSNIFSCRFLIIGILLSISINLFAEADGEQLFKQNCTACHSLGTSRLIGPGLEGVTEKYEKEWLFKWIRNSQALIQSGDERAIAIYEEYDKVAMTAFDFSDEELTSLLDYIANPPVKEEVLANTGSDENQGMSSSYQLILLFIVLLVVVFMLTSLKNSLKETLGQETESIPETLVNQYRLFTSNNLNILFVSLVGVVVALRITFDALMGIGVTTNYQPAQPIEFSHKVHAGMNGIDCNYCHSSARSSKHSGIPSANVCMNCHTYISEGTLTGTKEIAKIYDAVGFDSNTRTYIEDYQEKPIEWIRIHNLPDHVYFNHSQHVTVGGIECQECHGPIEEMDVVYQHADLTMGWCVDCHRTAEVKMEDNLYYSKLHDELKEKYKGEKITVDKMGGLECAKCHY